MKCSHAFELFDTYVNGTISPIEKQALENHIADCSSCRQQLETYRIFLQDADVEKDFGVPPQLNAKIQYTIHQASTKKAAPFRIKKQVLAYVTACSLLLMAGIFGASHYHLIRQTDQPPQPIHTPVPTAFAPSDESENAADQAAAPPTAPPTEAASASPAERPAVTPTPARSPTETKTPLPQSPATAVPEAVQTHNLPADPANEPQTYTNSIAEDKNEQFRARKSLGQEANFDVVVPSPYREEILRTYPHTLLAENLYRITITKAQLEQLTNTEFSVAETAADMTILFQ